MKTFIMQKGIWKTRNCFRYETFIYLFEFKGFSTWGKRDTISFYADFLIWPHHVRHPAANYWSGLGELRKINFLPLVSNLKNLFSFFKSPNPQPIASGHDVIHILSPISYLGFLLWHLWLSHPPRARVNTCTQCVHLTNPCTKPKGSQPN